jgi:hypothetical protein
LLSEEYDPSEKRLVGNFPQAFSHVALANTAFLLARLAGEAKAEGKPSISLAREASKERS